MMIKVMIWNELIFELIKQCIIPIYTTYNSNCSSRKTPIIAQQQSMMRAEKYSIREIYIKRDQDLQCYLFRQSCQLANVPQLRILAKQGNLLTIQVEQVGERLTQLLKVSKDLYRALSYFDNAISTCAFLCEKFGPFAISSQHLHVGHSSALKLWIHEDPVCNNAQLPLYSGGSGERAMMKSLLAVFKPYLSSRDYQILVKIDSLKQMQKAVWVMLLQQVPAGEQHTLGTNNGIRGQGNHKGQVFNFKSCQELGGSTNIGPYKAQHQNRQVFKEDLKKTLKKKIPKVSVNLMDHIREISRVTNYCSSKNFHQGHNTSQGQQKNIGNFPKTLNQCYSLSTLTGNGAKRRSRMSECGSDYLNLALGSDSCDIDRTNNFGNFYPKVGRSSNRKQFLQPRNDALKSIIENTELENVKQSQNWNSSRVNSILMETTKTTEATQALEIENPDSKISLKSKKTCATLQNELNQLFSSDEDLKQSKKIYDQIEQEFNILF